MPSSRHSPSIEIFVRTLVLMLRWKRWYWLPSPQDSNTLYTVYPSLLAKTEKVIRNFDLFLKLSCFLFRRLFSCTIQHLVCVWPLWDHLRWRWKSVMTQPRKSGSSVLSEGIKDNIFKWYIVVGVKKYTWLLLTVELHCVTLKGHLKGTLD